MTTVSRNTDYLYLCRGLTGLWRVPRGEGGYLSFGSLEKWVAGEWIREVSNLKDAIEGRGFDEVEAADAAARFPCAIVG